jgi:hypothetical protein
MNSDITLVSEKIMECLKRQGAISFVELETSLNASYNLVFLALDQMVRDNKISLSKMGDDYQITLPESVPSSLPNNLRKGSNYRQ